MSKTANWDFDVERVPMVAYHDGIKIPSDRDMIVRTDTHTQVGVVSAEHVVRPTTKGNVKIARNYYKVVTHKELVTSTNAVLEHLGMEYKATPYTSHNGGRFSMSYFFPNEAIEPVKGDFVNMRLDLLNSFDTSRPVGFELGGLRKVCSNGMTAYQKAFFEFKRHGESFEMDIIMAQLNHAVDVFRKEMNGFYKIMGKTPLTVRAGIALIQKLLDSKVCPEKYGEMVKTVWTNPEMANFIIPELDHTGRVVENEFKHVMTDPSLDAARTVWTFYNAWTLIITHAIASAERRTLIHQAVRKTIDHSLK